MAVDRSEDRALLAFDWFNGNPAYKSNDKRRQQSRSI